MPLINRVPFPPPLDNPQLRQYLGTIADAVNALPALSVFSFTTPESNVTAEAGTDGFNEASTSLNDIPRRWVKEVGSGNTGWASLSTN